MNGHRLLILYSLNEKTRSFSLPQERSCVYSCQSAAASLLVNVVVTVARLVFAWRGRCPGMFPIRRLRSDISGSGIDNDSAGRPTAAN
mmetsp:Transcript_17414/g.29795  ORF Transcript_17414/g.29795 Transcript_17414/m.29795 type:complete len:88 (-) Transcript_17414:462-725(-)